MRLVRPLAALAIAASLATTAACSSTTAAQNPKPTLDPVAFQVRPILRESVAPGGACAPAPRVSIEVDQPVTLCAISSGSLLDLAPASVTSASIATLDAAGFGTGSWVLNVSLNDAGKETFRNVTEQILPSPPPLNRLAILIDGAVVSVAIVNEPITGGQIEVNGLTEADATAFAARFNG